MNSDDLQEVLIPLRAARRQMAGARCAMCQNGIVAVDMAQAVFSEGSLPVHVQCGNMLVQAKFDEQDEEV